MAHTTSVCMLQAAKHCELLFIAIVSNLLQYSTVEFHFQYSIQLIEKHQQIKYNNRGNGSRKYQNKKDEQNKEIYLYVC